MGKRLDDRRIEGHELLSRGICCRCRRVLPPRVDQRTEAEVAHTTGASQAGLTSSDSTTSTRRSGTVYVPDYTHFTRIVAHCVADVHASFIEQAVSSPILAANS